MQDIVMCLCVAAFETIIIHTLFNKIFHVKENCINLIVLGDICIGIIIFLMEMKGEGILIVIAETAAVLLYGCLLFAGNIYKRVFYGIMYSLIYLAGHLIIYFLYIINSNIDRERGVFGWSIYVDTLFIEIVTFLLMLFMIYKSKKSYGREQYGDTFKIFIIVPASSILLLVSLYNSDVYKYAVRRSSGLLLLSIFFIVISNIIVQNMLENYASIKYNEYVGSVEKLQSEMEHKYYKRIEKSNKEYMELIHNIKQHFTVIYAMSGDNEYVQNYLRGIDDRLNSVAKIMYCDNQILNAILSEKKDAAELKGILCDIKIDKDVNTGTISDIDIIEIVGNMFDNAIEASEKIKDMESRKIWIKGYMTNDKRFFSFSIENLCDTLPEEINGVYKTSKADGKNHGIGITSIKKIADKNNGYVDIMVREKSEKEHYNTFKIVIMLPILP